MSAQGYTTAREHAVRASELLNVIDAVDERMQNLTEEEHVQLLITGGIKRHNMQVEFTRDLALAHAQAALALAATEET
jgi:hypothetical protein